MEERSYAPLGISQAQESFNRECTHVNCEKRGWGGMWCVHIMLWLQVPEVPRSAILAPQWSLQLCCLNGMKNMHDSRTRIRSALIGCYDKCWRLAPVGTHWTECVEHGSNCVLSSMCLCILWCCIASSIRWSTWLLLFSNDSLLWFNEKALCFSLKANANCFSLLCVWCDGLALMLPSKQKCFAVLRFLTCSSEISLTSKHVLLLTFFCSAEPLDTGMILAQP